METEADRWADRKMGGRRDAKRHSRTDNWIDRQTDGQKYGQKKTDGKKSLTKRHTEKQKGR